MTKPREHSATESFVKFFNWLLEQDGAFVKKLRKAHPQWWSRRRHFIAEKANEIYSTRPELKKSNAKKLHNGWFIDTHLSIQEMKRRVATVCDITKIEPHKIPSNVLDPGSVLYPGDKSQNKPRWTAYTFEGETFLVGSATQLFVGVFNGFIGHDDKFVDNAR